MEKLVEKAIAKVINVKNVKEYENLRDKGLVVIDYNTTWCGPCRKFAPVFEEMASQHSDITFLSVDSEKIEHEECFNIRSVPTFAVFLNGEKKREFSGVDKERLETYIERYRIQIYFNGKVKRKFTEEEKNDILRYLDAFSE